MGPVENLSTDKTCDIIQTRLRREVGVSLATLVVMAMATACRPRECVGVPQSSRLLKISAGRLLT